MSRPHTRSRLRAAAVFTAAGVLGAGLATALSGSSAQAAPHDVSTRLGLPGLSTAQRYNQAPRTRTVRPTTVQDATPTLFDYVTPASAVSESPAHALQADAGSSTAQVDGVTVRRSGTTAGARFSYLMHANGRDRLTVRVEEAGSATSAYDVLAGGAVVHRRRPTSGDYAFGGRPIGLEHYTFDVPASAVASNGTVRITFRNTAEPGEGAQIAGVWVSGTRGKPTAPYGGTVAQPRGAYTGKTTTLRSDIFGRPYVVYDFGHEVAGTVRVHVANRDGAPELGFAFSESRQFLTTASDFSQDPSGVATETHYFTPKSGRSTIDDPVIRGGFRYLMVFLAAPGEVSLSQLTVHVTADPTNSDLDAYRGAFLSSDSTLNKLWYAGAYTTQLSTIASDTGRPYPAQPGPVHNDVTVAKGPVFLSDGAKRDRLDWGGDNAVSGPVALLSTGEQQPIRDSLEWFGDHPFSSGQVPGVYLPAPAGFNAGWGEYALWWVHNVWQYYLYTGDTHFLRTYYPVLERNLAWVETAVGSDGLWNVPGGASGHWGYGEAGKETYDNALYCLVLRDAAGAADAMKDTAQAATYRAHDTRTADAINAALWDDATGAYRALPDSGGHPLDANAMAVWSGVAGTDRARRAMTFVQHTLATPNGELAVDNADGNSVSKVISPFVGYQELQADTALATSAGDDEAMSALRRTWAHMLTGADTTGTFWETVSPTGGLGLGSYTSMSHGWSSGPTAYLSNQVLGVTPTAGGFAQFTVAPHPTPGVRWAEGRVPTPKGPIEVAWRMRGNTMQLAVSAPAGERYSVAVPAGKRMTVNGHEVRGS